ncbi:MAG: thioredoxin family protein [Magnetococcales bacterium]|nr:thioredoxin family protein [Magnetococcales bacterium]
MKTFKVLGTGCKNCTTTTKLIEEKSRSLGIEVQIEKVTDLADILGHGVMSTPGVVLDGQVIHAGSVPSGSQVEQWLKQ